MILIWSFNWNWKLTIKNLIHFRLKFNSNSPATQLDSELDVESLKFTFDVIDSIHSI